MNLKTFIDKYECKEIQILLALIGLMRKAIKVQSNILTYQFTEDELAGQINTIAPKFKNKLLLIKK